MIVNKTSTNKAKITNVRVFDDFSFVTVPNNEANKILKKFSSEKVGGTIHGSSKKLVFRAISNGPQVYLGPFFFTGEKLESIRA